MISFNDDQKDALLRWLGFSVLFGLLPYILTAAFETGSDVFELFGDGSLNLLGLGLTVAAGVATFGDVSKVRSHLAWFFVITVCIVFTAASYAYIRSELRSAAASASDLPNLRAAVESDLQRRPDRGGAGGGGDSSRPGTAASPPGGGPAASGVFEGELPPSEAAVNEELRRILEALEGELNHASEQVDPTGLKTDAVNVAIQPIFDEFDHRQQASDKALREARIAAMGVGLMSLVMGVTIGGLAEYVVNGGSSRHSTPSPRGTSSP